MAGLGNTYHRQGLNRGQHSLASVGTFLLFDYNILAFEDFDNNIGCHNTGVENIGIVEGMVVVVAAEWVVVAAGIAGTLGLSQHLEHLLHYCQHL